VETREFWQARSADLRRDLPLLGACIGDIKQRCNSTEFGMGRVLRCLKVCDFVLGRGFYLYDTFGKTWASPTTTIFHRAITISYGSF
jgi:hypothetical protein